MITIRYRPVMDLSARHGFFGGAPCPDLTFEPSEGAITELRETDLRCEPGAGTARLWTKSKDDKVTLDTPLAFWLRSTNPAFASYTEPDWSSGEDPGIVLSFGPDGARPGALLPSSGAAPLHTRPPRFDIKVPKAAPKTPFAVHRIPLSAPIQTGEITGSVAAVDLTGDAEGRYGLSVAGRVVEDFVLLSGLSAPPLGCVTLAPTTLDVPPARQDPLALSLQFKARTLLWEVVVLTNSSADLSAAKVELTGADVAFSAPSQGQTRGQEAWSFRSANPLPLITNLPEGVHFALRPNAAGLPVDVSLPLPTPASLVTGKDELLARVYVQV